MTMFSRFSFLNQLWRKPLMRVFLSAFVLFILFVMLPIPDLLATIKRIPFWFWVLAVLSLMAGHVVGVMKWSILINTSNNRLPLLSTFRCYFAGLFANMFLPSMTGGDIVRAGLAIRLNKNKEAVILGSLFDRILDASTLVLIAFSGSLLFSKTLFAGTYRTLFGTLLLILLFVLCCVILIVAPLRWGRPKFFVNSTRRYHLSLKEFTKHPLLVLLALCASIVIQMWFVLLSFVLAWKIGISLSFKVWLMVWPMAKLSAMLPISIGGLGVREAALAALLSQFGVGITRSVGLGLLWESLFFAVGGLGGLFYILTKKEYSHTRIS